MIVNKYITRSPEETRKVAEEISKFIESGNVIALTGGLGTGKTTFVQGLAKGLEVIDNVNSPTFKLINEFEGRIPLFHFDFYRINLPREVVNLDLERYLFGEGITVIEWADRFPQYIPDEAIQVEFDLLSEQVREITIRWMEEDESSSY